MAKDLPPGDTAVGTLLLLLQSPFCVLSGGAHPLLVGQDLAEKESGEGVLAVGGHLPQAFNRFFERGGHNRIVTRRAARRRLLQV
jgi:hypothetical protein